MSILIYQGQSNRDFFEVLNVNLYVNPFLANVPILYRLKTPENQRQKQPPGVFCKKGVLRNLAKFTGKHLYLSLFFDQVAHLRPATLLKQTLWHNCFLVNFAKYLRTPFYRTPLGDYFCTGFLVSSGGAKWENWSKLELIKYAIEQLGQNIQWFLM